MNELLIKNIMIRADTIKGEINRMCVTRELTELETMKQHALINIKELFEENYRRLTKEGGLNDES